MLGEKKHNKRVSAISKENPTVSLPTAAKLIDLY